ncbi:hypothetical protein PGTUg99_029208 [Puccinia graminis f. sp. tritici]|uniref:Uncharacterized protein n=1 Tax=Puccinia graminis f. sp. tritici TaxID=56615 RepID=A0A5B0P163_PUCGR|nr:hypothetical protein PGTUg99_029208 [Puccinia graminis f. sp. tritici]
MKHLHELGLLATVDFNATTDSKERELFAELCLTVPVRLSVLLPYLTYLMRPLVIALQAAPDLVSQGLRTLELCVDNLTQEIFTPLMALVIHDVMTSLWKLLKPLPYNPNHAHVALRILGKLGGRNQKVLRPKTIEECQVRWSSKKSHSSSPGSTGNPTDATWRHSLQKEWVWIFGKHHTRVFINGEREETFSVLLKGLFDATRVPEFSVDAESHLSSLFEHVFITEIWQEPGPNPEQARYSLSLTNTIIDALIDNLTIATDQNHLQAASQFMHRVFQKLFQHAKTTSALKEDILTYTKRTLCRKASSSCYDHSWPRKCAGHQVLSILVNRTETSASWITDFELEIIGALLFLHKDAPSATEKILEAPTDMFWKLLRPN